MSARGKFILSIVIFACTVILLYVVPLPVLECDRNGNECELLTSIVPLIPEDTFAIAEVKGVAVLETKRRRSSSPYFAITLQVGDTEYRLPGANKDRARQQRLADQLTAFLANPAQQQFSMSTTQHPVMFGPIGVAALAMWLFYASVRREAPARTSLADYLPQPTMRQRGDRSTPPRRRRATRRRV